MSLDRLLFPQSVAVVGATDRLGSYAEATLSNLRLASFSGEVVGVHPTRTDVLGFRTVESLADCGPVDAVVIATPAPTVAEYVRQARELGCGGAIVYAADFAEAGNSEAQLALAQSAGDLPVIGPNCNGVVSVAARAPLWGDAVILPRSAGPIGLITQSGNVGVIALAHRGGLGLHTVVSVGNCAVTDSADVLGAMSTLPGIRVVAMYLEDDGDAARMCEALASCADHDVRVVVLKAGRSAAGAQAGAAHTAALAGDQKVFAELMREAGAVMVREPGELIETARALSMVRRDSRGVGVLTCSGGDAVMAADIAHDMGARLATFGNETVVRLQQLLPRTATAVNPLDHTNHVWADTDSIAAIAAAVAGDPDVGHLVYVQDQPPTLPDSALLEWAASRQGGIRGGELSGLDTMVVNTTAGQESDDSVSGLIPAMAAFAQVQQAAPSGDRLRAIGRSASMSAAPLVVYAEHEAKELLRAAGIAVPVSAVAADGEAAADLAEHIGFPVVLKLSAAGLVHKSDIGAVRIGLSSRSDVIAAARDLKAISGLPADAALVVESMVPGDVEMFVSAHRQGVVPVVVVGTGGVWVEALDDCVVVALPASRAQIVQAIRDGLRTSGRLFGDRGQNTLAVDRLAQMAVDVGDFLIQGGYSLIELNPVLVDEHDAVAVDAVVR